MVYDRGMLEIPSKLYLRNVWMEVNGTISDSLEYTIDQKGSLSVWSTGHTANYPKGFYHFHNLTVRSQGLLYATATDRNTEVTVNATLTVVNAGGVISGNRLRVESTNLTVDMAGNETFVVMCCVFFFNDKPKVLITLEKMSLFDPIFSLFPFFAAHLPFHHFSLIKSLVQFSFSTALLACLIFIGLMTATSRGYATAQGPAYDNIQHLLRLSGGGHGGRGGFGPYDLATTYAYGSSLDPNTWGSGGKGDGGRGGGFLALRVYNKLRVEGTIASNGESKLSGGAGGSIRIDTHHLDGDGVIETSGGDGSNGGGGSGGRIAVYYGNQSTYIGVIQALGGSSSSDIGAAGTVYIQNSSIPSAPHRILKVVNRNSERILKPQTPQLLKMPGSPSSHCPSTSLNYANGIHVSTSSTPYCHLTSEFPLWNMFRKGAFYLSVNSVAAITVTLPFAMFVHSVDVYPVVHLNNQTAFKLSTYLASSIVTTGDWIEPFGAYNGLGEKITLNRNIDKVRLSRIG